MPYRSIHDARKETVPRDRCYGAVDGSIRCIPHLGRRPIVSIRFLPARPARPDNDAIWHAKPMAFQLNLIMVFRNLPLAIA